MLNLAGFGPDEHQLMIQAGIDGLGTSSSWTSTRSGTACNGPRRSSGSSRRRLRIEGWWDQARTLEEE